MAAQTKEITSPNPPPQKNILNKIRIKRKEK
jgi:hypothetical protein